MQLLLELTTREKEQVYYIHLQILIFVIDANKIHKRHEHLHGLIVKSSATDVSSILSKESMEFQTRNRSPMIIYLPKEKAVELKEKILLLISTLTQNYKISMLQLINFMRNVFFLQPGEEPQLRYTV